MPQEARKPVDEVLRGLGTTSAKIRALAKAGYFRTEIRDLLDIRYQHMRKVLEDAGISEGRQRTVEASRSLLPVIPTGRDERQRIPWETLLEAGFQHVGNWVMGDDGILRIDGNMLREAGVYAFVLDNEVVYVGLTFSGLHNRMNQYRRGYEKQRTSSRINGKIRNALAEGRSIRVLIATPPPLEWNGLPVNTAAGLEAGLIELLRPAWNIQGAGDGR